MFVKVVRMIAVVHAININGSFVQNERVMVHRFNDHGIEIKNRLEIVQDDLNVEFRTQRFALPLRCILCSSQRKRSGRSEQRRSFYSKHL